MDFDLTRQYLLNKPEAIEDFPFYPDVPVFKVKGKMFAILGVDDRGEDATGAPQVSLKCDPEQALALRFFFDAVKPGYHLNKKHWNTVNLDGSVPPKDIQRMIDHSYALVVKGLKASERKALALAYGEEQVIAPAEAILR